MPVSRLRAPVWLVAAAVAGSFAGLACGSQDKEAVRESAKDFFARAATGDPRACELASQRYRNGGEGCLKAARALGAPSSIEPIEAVAEIEIDGDRATARVVSQGQRLSGLLVLVKEGDEWRFDNVEETAF